MTAIAKIRDLFRRKPPTMDDELRAKQEAERIEDEVRDRKVSRYSGGGAQYNAGAELEEASHHEHDLS